VARHQRRFCCLVGYSGGREGTFLVIPPGRQDDAALLGWLEHFYGAGTTLDVPLDVLPQRWEALGCPKGKTDLVLLTDGIVGLPAEIEQRFLAWKAAEKVRVITLLIGCEAGPLNRVSDETHRVSGVDVREEAVARCLSV
jgi:uncharacterized protein with von Willebrand factor type A (vWA) domain